MGVVLPINVECNKRDTKWFYECNNCKSVVTVSYSSAWERIKNNREDLCQSCSAKYFERNPPVPTNESNKKGGLSRTIYTLTKEQIQKTKEAQWKTRHLWKGRIKYSGKFIPYTFCKDIGCSHEFFVQHIINQFDSNMNVLNYGSYWNFDHITPLRQAIEESNESFIAASHYSNIRPLKIIENIQRRGRYHGKS